VIWSIRDIAKLMNQKRIGSVLIKTKKGLGILTERDILNKVIVPEKNPGKLKAEDVMTFPILTVDDKTGLYEICRIFNEHHIRRLPVLENGEVIGIITTRDVVKQYIPQLIKETYKFKDFKY
jgi:signal-transduction protein with cAMP-binding, CBS, and nucleotidyltransferase domain